MQKEQNVHKTQKISTTLVVDDFGIKLEKQAGIKVNYNAKHYNIGITLDWNYDTC
jgi:hypothetical protein